MTPSQIHLWRHKICFHVCRRAGDCGTQNGTALQGSMVLCTLNNTLFVVTTLPLRDTLHTQFQLHVPSSSFLVCSIACNSYSQNHNFIRYELWGDRFCLFHAFEQNGSTNDASQRLHSQSKEQVKDISDNTRTQDVRGWRLNTTNCTTHLFMTHSVLVQAPKPFVLVCSCNAWVIACNNFIQSY